MLHPTTDYCICLSLIVVVCSFVCLAECGECPREVVCQPLCCEDYRGVRGSYDGLLNGCSSCLSSDYGSGHQKTVPLADDGSELFPSTVCGLQSEAQCLKAGNLDMNRGDSGAALPKQSVRSDGNVSWSSDDVVFRFPDGETITCSLKLREFGHDKLPISVNGGDQIVKSSCRGHLLYNKKTSFDLPNIEVEKSSASESSSPRVDISPCKLNWGQNYLYHSSVVTLRLKNTCNESVLTVYEPFSTDSQFYPFNFSEVVLGPGEVTSISFAYLPDRLGLSSAELVLLTSLGGFLVEAKGLAVESPYRLRPLMGLDASSGGRMSRKLSLSNPFDETIDLEEVNALVTISESSGVLLVESICRKQNHRDSSKHRFTNVKRVLNGDSGQMESIVMAVRPLSNWLISPHITKSILEMVFSPESEGKVVGGICMEFLKSQEGEKDLLVVPFEAELNKTATWKDTASSLSVSIEVVGPCDANETTISVSVTNRASHLLKIVKVNEVSDSMRLLQIKFLEGLLLFPGTVTPAALVTYKSLDVKFDTFLQRPDVSLSCKLEILVNGSISPLLEIPCLEIFGICPRRQQETFLHMADIVDPRNRTGSLTSMGQSPILTKALRAAEADKFVHEGWRTQSTMSGLYLLDKHELLFPVVPIGKYDAKLITVRNPSQHPVIVQLILNPGETVDKCKACYSYQHSPFLVSSICNGSTAASRYGFSVVDSTVTEAFLHPYGTVSLGPILFHPSNRCEWKSSAFIRSNLSGLEFLSLRGFGGSLSLFMLEGSEQRLRLDFNMNLPSPPNTSNIADVSSGCRKPSLKKLIALNAGDFPVNVERIDVSGRECGLDGFIVHNCRGFSLVPGESLELGLSYQSDFSGPVVRRDLQLIMAVGMLVIPMQASMPLHAVNVCKKAYFWLQVKTCCLTIALAAVIFSLLFWLIMPLDLMEYLNKGEKRFDPISSPRAKSSTPLHNQGEGKAIRSAKKGHLKNAIIAEHKDRSMECQTEPTIPSDAVKEIDFSPSLLSKSKSVEKACKLEVAQPVCLTVKTRKEKKRRSRKRNALVEVSSSQSGNSTPSSPLSPTTTLSPPESCSPDVEKMQPRDSLSPEPVASAKVSTQQHFRVGSKKMGNQAVLLPSATFPGTRTSPSRLAMAQHARAPGPNVHPQKAVQFEENARAEEDRFTYNIWGNHFSGLHLSRPNSSFTIASGTVGHSNSFFLKGPQQTLMTNSAASICK